MDDKTRILVVDDEEILCEALKFNLELEGYEVDTAYSAEEALTFNLADYSLILLDIMMGDISGVQMARILKRREDTAGIPIIFCTARDSDDDIIDGLNLGADDYITKPYTMGVMMARVKSVLRRASAAAHAKPDEREECLRHKGLEVYPQQKVCKADGKTVKLPRKEFELLALMMRNMGKIFSREELLSRIWPDEVVVLDRVVDVNITRLRSKIGEYGKNIVTRIGYGYGFAD